MSTSPQNLPPVCPSADSPVSKQELNDWKQDLNERIAAHRNRRSKVAAAQVSLPLDVEEQPVRSRARVAARVAERYAKVPTYREVLALQVADRAEIETRIDTGTEAKTETGTEAKTDRLTEPNAETAPYTVGAASEEVAGYPDSSTRQSSFDRQIRPTVVDDKLAAAADAFESKDLYASDKDKGAAETGEWIPGNLIEFPRVLVAARRARPRLAEGPLREDATVDTDPERSQLRIFEVEQQAISAIPQVEVVATEWSSIRLDARRQDVGIQDATASEARHDYRRGAQRPSSEWHVEVALHSAPLSDRLMAGLVDMALVALAFLGFVAVFVACTTHPPAGKPAWIAAFCTLAAFFLLYQFLFFSYSEGTPGMRYARIALCTFDDENPTRRQMRSRIGSLLLSACPLALGFAWAWFDENRLGWHDRMTRTYQRSYR